MVRPLPGRYLPFSLCPIFDESTQSDLPASIANLALHSRCHGKLGINLFSISAHSNLYSWHAASRHQIWSREYVEAAAGIWSSSHGSGRGETSYQASKGKLDSADP